jgi:ubiquinone/menaquinone biosynthesis C-methylase UbiE
MATSSAPSFLERNEPRFARYWFAHHEGTQDPQFDRWVEYEGSKLAVAEERVQMVIAQHFPVAGRRVLDLGSQWGATCVALNNAGAEAVGVDVSEELASGARIRAAEQGAQAEFFAGKAEALPFETASFDAIVCDNVVEHVESHDAMIREIARVLRPGGDLYFDGPSRLSPKLLWSDPHYGMKVVSAMPERLGRFYVTRVRGYPEFLVGTFPVPSAVVRKMRSQGLRIVSTSQRGPSFKEAAVFNLRQAFWVHAQRT